MKKISIVIGLYNSSKTIGKVLEEIDHELSLLEGYTYEVILVDDCGQDNVLEIVKNIAAQDKRIKVVSLAKNSGQTNAVMTGYSYATGDYIVEMDDDYQMPAYEIGRMIEKLEQDDLDVVFAKYKEHKESLFRRFGSFVNAKMAEVMIDKPKDITINSFFVMRSMVKDVLLAYKNNYPYLYGSILSATSHIGNVEVEHRPRLNGKSNYTFKSLVKLWLNGMLNYSIRPLRIATALGMGITGVGFVVAMALIIQRLMIPTNAMGWTSIMVTIIFFAGVELLSIGLLGEYIGRLFLSSSGVPRNVVRETVNIEKTEDREK